MESFLPALLVLLMMVLVFELSIRGVLLRYEVNALALGKRSTVSMSAMIAAVVKVLIPLMLVNNSIS